MLSAEASGRYHAERQVRSKVGVAERAQHVGMEKGEYPRPVRRKGRDAQDHAHRAAADEHVAMRRFTPPPRREHSPGSGVLTRHSRSHPAPNPRCRTIIHQSNRSAHRRTAPLLLLGPPCASRANRAPRGRFAAGVFGMVLGTKAKTTQRVGVLQADGRRPVSNQGPTALGTGVARKAIRDAGGNGKRPPARCARLGRAVVLMHADRAKAAPERRMAFPAVLARIAMLPHALPFPGQEGAGGALPAPPYHG